MKITIIITALLAGYLLYGCKTATPRKPTNSRSMVEDRLVGRRLVGTHKKVLIETLGKPKYILNASAPGAPATRSYVYDVVEEGQPCAASYLVALKTDKVISYSCF